MDWLGFAFTPASIAATITGGVVAGVSTGMFMVFMTLFYGRSRS